MFEKCDRDTPVKIARQKVEVVDIRGFPEVRPSPVAKIQKKRNKIEKSYPECSQWSRNVLNDHLWS